MLVYRVTLHIVNVDGMEPDGQFILSAAVPCTYSTWFDAPFPLPVPLVAEPATSVPCRPFPLMSVNLFRLLSQFSAVAARYGGYSAK